MARLMTYGAGSIWAFRTDIANATPMKIADLEEGSVQWSGKLVKKYGQSRVPIAIARGEEEIKGKLKFASQQARILSDLFHGVPLKSGMLNTSNAEPATAAASVVVQHASSFLFDNGVMNVNNAVPFQRVNSNPAVGQYSLNVATGTYTFSGADATALVPILISYGYTDTTVAGQTLSVVNAQQGTQPAFQITMEDVFNGPTGLQKKTLVLNYAIGTSYNESGKNGDFKSPELDFEAGDPGTGIIATYSYNGLS